MISERRHLLTRCLRLEARIVDLQRELAGQRRPPRRSVTPADRAQMHALRQQGNGARAIAQETGWSIGTVYNALAEALL